MIGINCSRPGVMQGEWIGCALRNRSLGMHNILSWAPFDRFRANAVADFNIFAFNDPVLKKKPTGDWCRHIHKDSNPVTVYFRPGRRTSSLDDFYTSALPPKMLYCWLQDGVLISGVMGGNLNFSRRYYYSFLSIWRMTRCDILSTLAIVRFYAHPYK